MDRPPILDGAYADWTDEQVAQARAASLSALQAAAGPEAARALYQQRLLPLEREGVWRDRLAEPSEMDLVFITVGGQADTPTQAGLRWPAKRVVLLHSERTRPYADQAAKQLGLSAAHCELRSIGTGTDPLRLYRVLKEVWLEKGRPTNVVVDLTGGFKTMSAAAAAAGFLIPGTRVAYVETEQHRLHGSTFWLDTRVQVLSNPIEVFGDLDRNAALGLLTEHRFAPAARAWRDLADRTRRRPDEWYATLAEALDAGDRLRFAEGAAKLQQLLEDIPRDLLLAPTLEDHPLALPDARDWMRRRAAGFSQVDAVAGKDDPMNQPKALASPAMLHLIALLLGLARRRLDAGETDLAGLYAYRASEGIPQRRLTLLGFDIQQFDWDRAMVHAGADSQDQRETLLRRVFGRKPGEPVPPLRSRIDRSVGYQVLDILLKDGLVDPRDRKLQLHLGEARNRSLLAHGVASISDKTAGKLVELTEATFARLLERDGAVPAAALAHWREGLPPGVGG